MSPPPPPNLLIDDDDPELRRFLQGELELLVLDWTLPDFSGVLMLTARDAVSERVEALDAGATAMARRGPASCSASPTSW